MLQKGLLLAKIDFDTAENELRHLIVVFVFGVKRRDSFRRETFSSSRFDLGMYHYAQQQAFIMRT